MEGARPLKAPPGSQQNGVVSESFVSEETSQLADREAGLQLATMAGDINQLPEECISLVISFTTPHDACVSSTVSRSFRSAADSDLTWQRFLPSDYAAILARAVNPVEFASKKELYFRLCHHPTVIDRGVMSFRLEFLTDYSSIAWGDDLRHLFQGD